MENKKKLMFEQVKNIYGNSVNVKSDEHKILNLAIEINNQVNVIYQDIINQLTASEIIEAKNDSDSLIEKLIGIIENNIEEPELSVYKLAEFVGMSRASLYRKLVQKSHLSPNELIRNVRLNKAAQLLKQKSKNVSQVMYAVGYNSKSAFSEGFKKQFGVLPSKYK